MEVKVRDFLRSMQAEDEEASVDITPMLDVVFIMLIFFIVTATFIKEAGIDVDKPDAATAVVQEKASILVAIDASDNVWINRRQVDIRSVRSIIERLHAENPKGTVVIQADRESRNNTLVEVMDASRRAGVYDIALAAVVE
jgi:biopolymer transport protein ExbD